MAGYVESWGKTRHARNAGVFFFLKTESEEVYEGDREKKQEGIQGQWQHESLAKQYVEQVKCCEDTDCAPRMMKQVFFFVEKWRVGRISKHFQG